MTMDEVLVQSIEYLAKLLTYLFIIQSFLENNRGLRSVTGALHGMRIGMPEWRHLPTRKRFGASCDSLTGACKTAAA
jgi:hypothetical protein